MSRFDIETVYGVLLENVPNSRRYKASLLATARVLHKLHVECLEQDDNAHKHNFQLAEIIDGKPIYNLDGCRGEMSFAQFMANRVEVGRNPDKAIFVCECGASKSVEMTA